MSSEPDVQQDAIAHQEREAAQLRLSFFIIAIISVSWCVGAIGLSFPWVIFLMVLVFTVWLRKSSRIIEERVRDAEIKVHRRKALRSEETAEWLNFVINRWWIFSETSLTQIIKSSLDPVLEYSKPGFIESMELVEFTFGSETPFVKYIKVFENIDEGDSPNIPVTEETLTSPPVDTKKRQRHLLVFNMDICMNAPDTRIVIRVRLGGKNLGSDVDVCLGELCLGGRAQIVMELDHLIPFPHLNSVAVTFLEKPEVGFDVQMLKAVQVMDIPVLKDFINALVMDSLTFALVDPGRITVPLYPQDAEELINAARKTTYACGVLTITAKGGLPQKFTDDVVWGCFKLNEQEKNAEKTSGGTSWESSFSFLVYDLASDQLVIEIRAKRSFGTKYTIAKYKVYLNNLNLEKRNSVEKVLEKEGVRGSKIELTMEYNALPIVEVSNRTDEKEFLEKFMTDENQNFEEVSGVVLINIHSGSKLLGLDDDGYSDPYCIIAANREKAHVTQHVSGTINPVWDSTTEFFVRDVTRTSFSFLVYDRDANWQGQSDDFMGSCNLELSLEKPAVIKNNIDLMYKVYGKKRSEDEVMPAGSISVSAVFRPINAVSKTEPLTEKKGVGEGEDIEDINEHAKRHSSKTSQKVKKQVEEMMLIKERGVLVLSILQGKDLVAMDSNGLSDPFCIVKVGEEKKYKTAVIYETLTPVWNESVTFAMPGDNDKLTIDMFDKDAFKKEAMGSVSLTGKEIKESASKGVSQWFKLQDVDNGEIQLRFKVSSQGSKGESAETEGDVDVAAQGEPGEDSGYDTLADTDEGKELVEVEAPTIYYTVSGEVIQANNIKGWTSVYIKGRIDIVKKNKKGQPTDKYDTIPMCKTDPVEPESGLTKWNTVFQVLGNTAIPTGALLIFELKDVNKKTIGGTKISIDDFFKDTRMRKRSDLGKDHGCISETKWMDLEFDGNPVGKLQMMISYSDIPDAPLVPGRKQNILRQKMSSMRRTRSRSSFN